MAIEKAGAAMAGVARRVGSHVSLSRDNPAGKQGAMPKRGNDMESGLIGAAVILVIWIINGKKIAYGITEKIPGEVYHHTGIGIFLTLIVIETLHEKAGMFIGFDIFWLKVIGYVLFIPSALFIFGSLYQLRMKGKAGSLGPQGATRLVDTGVFGMVRHPMWLGFSLWSVAVILCFQSLLSFVLGAIAIICFRMASVKEDDEGIKALGDVYREYMKKVPMWNFFKGPTPGAGTRFRP